MVKNDKMVLDEGILKNISEVIMPAQKTLYEKYSDTKWETKKIHRWDDLREDMIVTKVPNPKYKRPNARMNYADRKFLEYQAEWDWINYPKGPDWKKLTKRWETWAGGEDKICDYLGIIPFIPSVMINISPDWKSAKNIDIYNAGGKIKILQEIIESYFEEGWYSRGEYVIENGSKGDHIHAHCVFTIHKDREKSCLRDGPEGKKTHIRQGRHFTQLRKYMDKIKGMEGILKGPGLQSSILRNEILVKDKIDYLTEEKKPCGHKNHSVIFDKKVLVF